MAKKQGGLISRLIMGSEKSEGYARSTLPSNRWGLFWDIFKGRFWKLVLVNLLMLIFFLPLIALLVFRSMTIAGFGISTPFSQPFGVGYQSFTSLVGVPESILVNVNITMYAFLPIALIIAGLGVAGGAYVIRNMVWTEGIFVANDFWRGIKQNFKPMCFIGVVYSLVFYVVQLSITLVNQMLAVGTGNAGLLIFSKVMAYIVLAFFTIMMFHMINMSVTYELKFRHLIKNTFLLTIGMLPQNIFFVALSLIPLALTFLGGIFSALGYIAIILFGLSLCLLVWTDFCQWAYDKFINDNVAGAKKNRGIYEKIQESDSESLRKYREQVAMSESSLSSKPIKPITDDELKLAELPTSFSRRDIEKLNESRRILYEDHERYVEEHKNDAQFANNAESQKTEEQIEREKRITQAKKELAKNKKIKKK